MLLSAWGGSGDLGSQGRVVPRISQKGGWPCPVPSDGAVLPSKMYSQITLQFTGKMAEVMYFKLSGCCSCPPCTAADAGAVRRRMLALSS